jgi:hypothetical protein
MALTHMDTPVVHTAGRNVADLSGEAGAAGTGFLSAITDAQGSVVHDTVVRALDKYHKDWSPAANRMKVDVDNLGGSTSGSAVTIATGDADAGAATSTPAIDCQDMATRIGTTPVQA